MLGDARRLEANIDALHRKLDLIIQHLGIKEPDHLVTAHAEIDDLLQRGKKIEAIKRYRELTGAGLRQAKDAVEARERNGFL